MKEPSKGLDEIFGELIGSASILSFPFDDQLVQLGNKAKAQIQQWALENVVVDEDKILDIIKTNCVSFHQHRGLRDMLLIIAKAIATANIVRIKEWV